MIARRTINSFLISLLVCIAAGCSRADHIEYSFFQRDYNADKVVRQYSFKFEIDSNITYKTFIACRIDRKIITCDSIPLEISLLSPSGLKYGESISLPVVESEGIEISSTTPDIYDIEWPYREEIKLEEDLGEWNVMIKIADEQMAKGILGVGFSSSSSNEQ